MQLICMFFLLVFVPYETVSAGLVMVGTLFHVSLKCLCCVKVMVNSASQFLTKPNVYVQNFNTDPRSEW